MSRKAKLRPTWMPRCPAASAQLSSAPRPQPQKQPAPAPQGTPNTGGQSAVTNFCCSSPFPYLVLQHRCSRHMQTDTPRLPSPAIRVPQQREDKKKPTANRDTQHMLQRLNQQKTQAALSPFPRPWFTHQLLISRPRITNRRQEHPGHAHALQRLQRPDQ